MLLKGNIVFGSSSGLELMKNGDREGLIPNGQLATAAYEMLVFRLFFIFIGLSFKM